IRELEQQLRRATRRLEELERRESRRNASPRRSGNPRSETTTPETPEAPRAENASPRSPVAPTPPSAPARPVPPTARRSPVPPPGLGGGEGGGALPRGGGPGPRFDYERRFRELDEKLNRLLKELEQMKDERKPSESSIPRSRGRRPANTGTAVTS